MSTLRSKLTPLYAPFLPDLFDRQEVKEPRATCDSCAMCDKGGGADSGAVTMDYFKPDLKCCTYHPNIPNYLVGALLSDPAPELAEGQRRVRERIEKRIGITPCWVAAPKKYQLFMMAARGTDVFGRARNMLCPYFEKGTGNCTVWRYREAVCSTFFCKYEGGYPGFQFWMGLKEYLAQIEITLAHYAIKTVDPALVEPKMGRLKLNVEDIDDLPPKDDAYAAAWASWVGREAELYVACYEVVRKLDREAFAKLVDDTPDGKKHLDALRSLWDKLVSPIMPEHLVRNGKMRQQKTTAGVVVTTYNANDSFALDPELFEVLGMLDAGRSVEENLAWLASEHGIELTSELLHHLYIHGVLITPPRPAAAICAVPPRPAAKPQAAGG